MGKRVRCPAAQSWTGSGSERTHVCEWRGVVVLAIGRLEVVVEVQNSRSGELVGRVAFSSILLNFD